MTKEKGGLVIGRPNVRVKRRGRRREGDGSSGGDMEEKRRDMKGREGIQVVNRGRVGEREGGTIRWWRGTG